MEHRIHITGASGSGATTLGSHLSQALRCPHYDSDDYFWEKTNPPFTKKRSVSERIEMLKTDLNRSSSWILSGSLTGWGDPAMTLFTQVVLLHIEQGIRIERLRAREKTKHGRRIEPGGDMHQIHQDFIEWAKQYDEGGPEVRSRALHEEWLKQTHCPVVRIDGNDPTEQQVRTILATLERVFNYFP